MNLSLPIFNGKYLQNEQWTKMKKHNNNGPPVLSEIFIKFTLTLKIIYFFNKICYFLLLYSHTSNCIMYDECECWQKKKQLN